MKRRQFLETSALGCALAISQPASLFATGPSSEHLPPAAKEFELEELTITELQAGMQSGKYTARSLVKKYLDRIDEIDRNGPKLNSVIEVNPDAMTIAEALDRERKEKGARGPLHGIPILIKDNIDTADHLMTTAGSLALVGSRPAQDSLVAKKLREAGAVIIGKTNLSEWANFRSSHSSSGWSGRGGQTRNPYVLNRNPCGSSSGSGAANAANLCAIAVGTETDGSVVCPSSSNGLVGIKPTLGLVSRAGIIPIAHSQDTAGPMCRSVTDAAILLGVLAGADPADPATAHQPISPSDFTTSLDPNGLKGARIGVARGAFGNPEGDRLNNAAIAVLKAQGATIVDPVEIPHLKDYGDQEYTVLLYEFKADLNAYLAGLGAASPMKTLADLIAYNDAHKDTELTYFGQEIFMQAQEKGPLTDDAYVEALAHCRRLSRTEGVDVTFAKDSLDAIVAPTGGPAWLIDLVNGDCSGAGGNSSIAAVAGYPTITVPVGYSYGLPVGMSFIGKPWTEATLIKFAYAYEQAAKPRRAPRFLPTADLTRR